jgi:hypothetical protein
MPPLTTDGWVRVSLKDGTHVDTHANDPDLPVFVDHIVHIEHLEHEPIEEGWSP